MAFRRTGMGVVIRALVLATFSCVAISASGQTITSTQPGAWNNSATWGGGVIPTNGNSTLVQVNHAVNIPNLFNATAVGVTISNPNGSLTIDVGGSLSYTGTLTTGIAFPPLSGRLFVNGTLIVEQGATIVGSSNKVVVNGVYRHNYTTSAGTVYPATWNSGSTLEITGYTLNTSQPVGLNQAFHNVVWNCPGSTGTIFLDGTAFNTVNGDFTLTSTGFLGLSLTTNTNAVFNIGGNFTANDVLALSVGSGNSTLNIGGNLNLGFGDAIGYYGSGTGTVIFNGGSSQILTASGANSTPVNFTILTGSTLSIPNGNFLSGTGSLTLQSGSNLQVGDVNGITTTTTSGAIRVSGSRNYTAGANLVYNGVTQNLGSEWGSGGGLNAIAVNLELANGTTVTNNNIGSTSLVGVLTLTDGRLNIGNSNTLNIQGIFSSTSNGFIGGSTNSNLTFSGSGTISTLNFAGGANTLNNFTINRGTNVVLGTDLVIEGNLSFSSTGNLDISGRTLTIQGNNGDIIQPMPGSGGLISSSASDLVLGGTGALTIVPFSGSNQINNLTFSRTSSATYTWDSDVTVISNLFLNSGAVTHSSGLSMGAGSNFRRTSGATISAAPGAVSNYNLFYSGALTTGAELPSSASALNNLTVSGNTTLDKNVTVNGNILVSSGSLATSTFNLTMAGATFDVAGGTFTSSSTTTFSRTGSTVLTGAGSKTFRNLTINPGATLIAPSGNMNVTATWDNNGGFTPNGGLVTFNGGAQLIFSNNVAFDNVDFAGTGIKSLFEGLNVDNSLTISPSSTLSAGSQTISLAGLWSNSGTFTAGTGTVNFDGSSAIAGSSLSNFRNITISGTLASPTQLNVAGNFTNNGTLNAGAGEVVFNGSSAQTISGSTNTVFNDILVTNTANPISVQVTSAQSLAGILTLSSNSQFAAGNLLFTLLSTDDEPFVADAAIAEIPSGATISGNVIVQRYMSIEGGSNDPAFNNGRIYRYIASPVQNATVADLQNEIPVTGTFTTSSSCTGCGTTQSMFVYNEAETGDTNGSGGNDANDGYEDFPQNLSSETFAQGRGYTFFVRGNVAPVSTNGNARYDLRGPINAGTVDFVSTAGVSFTSSGVLANDGWNLIGNPYPSTIDWLSGGWTKSANVTNAIYMLDNGSAAGTYATFINGVGSNGGSQYIPIGQAFWVKLNAAGPTTLTATEAVKAPGQTTEFFRQAPPDDLLRITLRSGNLRDEAVVYFDENAELEFDSQLDALKLDNNIFNVFTTSPGGSKFAISSVPQLDCAFTTELQITNTIPGTYSLDFSEFESFTKQVDIILRDKLLNSIATVNSDPVYQFDVTDEENTYQDRFELTVIDREVNPSLIAQASNGENCKSGSITLEVNGAPVGGTYKWFENDTDLDPIAGAVGNSFTTPILTKTKTYYASVVSALGCEGPKTPVVAEIVNFDDAEIVELDGGALSSNFESGNQWFKDGVLVPGATNKTFLPTESGLYKVEVSIGSCKTSSERVFTVTGLEDEELFDRLVTVYPNPVSNDLTLRVSEEVAGKASVLDVSGKVLGEIEFRKEGKGRIGRFNFEGHAEGLYLIRISDKKGSVYNKRIIKK